MGRHLGYYVGISKSTELILMTAFSLWFNIFDMAIFEIKPNIDEIWSMELQENVLSETTLVTIKYITTGIVFTRALTLHVYIAFLITSLWPMVFGTQPGLMLPWLTVGAIKNIFTNIISILTGTYTCILYGPIRPACFEFFGYHITQFLPSLYMWLVGLSFYRDLKQPEEFIIAALRDSSEMEFDVAVRRRKAKSMANENIIRSQIESRTKNLTGTSALAVEEIFKTQPWDHAIVKNSRSLDTLLDMIVAEAEMMEWEDFEPLEEGLTIQEKTIKLLGLSKSEIDNIKQSKRYHQNDENDPIQMQKKWFGYNVDSPTTSYIHKNNNLIRKTSPYSNNPAVIRAIKSEIKISKDHPKIKIRSDFLQSIPEVEVCHVARVAKNLEGAVSNSNISYRNENPNEIYDSSISIKNVLAEGAITVKYLNELNDTNYKWNTIQTANQKIQVINNQRIFHGSLIEGITGINENDASRIKTSDKFLSHLKTVIDDNKTKFELDHIFINKAKEKVNGKNSKKLQKKETLNRINDSTTFSSKPNDNNYLQLPVESDSSTTSNISKKNELPSINKKKRFANLHSITAMPLPSEKVLQIATATSDEYSQASKSALDQISLNSTTATDKKLELLLAAEKSDYFKKNLSNIPLYSKCATSSHKSISESKDISSKSRLRNRKSKKIAKSTQFVESSSSTSNKQTGSKHAAAKLESKPTMDKKSKIPRKTDSTEVKTLKRISLRELMEEFDNSDLAIANTSEIKSQKSLSSLSTKQLPLTKLDNDEKIKKDYRNKLVEDLHKSKMSTGKFGLLSEKLYMEDGYSRLFDEKMAKQEHNKK